MKEKDEHAIDVNHASLDELAGVPGLGLSLAARVIDARPYQQLEDVARVRGISAAMVERMRPFLALIPITPPDAEPLKKKSRSRILPTSPPEMAEPPVAAVELQPAPPVEPPAPVAESTAAPSQVVTVPETQIIPTQEPPQVNKLWMTINPPAHSTQPPQTPPPAQPYPPPARPVTRSEALAWGIGGALVTMILTVLATLGILLAVNGTLALTPAANYNALQRSMDAFSMQVDSLKQDATSLRSRLDTLDSLTGRLGLAEKDMLALRGQLDSSLKNFDQVQAQIKQSSADIAALQESSSAFQRFLDGLRGVLLSTAPQATPQQQTTP